MLEQGSLLLCERVAYWGHLGMLTCYIVEAIIRVTMASLYEEINTCNTYPSHTTRKLVPVVISAFLYRYNLQSAQQEDDTDPDLLSEGHM